MIFREIWSEHSLIDKEQKGVFYFKYSFRYGFYHNNEFPQMWLVDKLLQFALIICKVVIGQLAVICQLYEPINLGPLLKPTNHNIDYNH